MIKTWLRKFPHRNQDWVKMDWDSESQLIFLYKVDGTLEREPYFCREDALNSWYATYEWEFTQIESDALMDQGL